MSRPLVLGHRGAPERARENTPAAIISAAALGADGVELDVRMTADGHLVLIHDSTVRGLRVATATLADLRAIAEVATLEEGLEAAAGLFTNLELKGPVEDPATFVDRTAALLAGWSDPLLVTSFWLPFLSLVREALPDALIGVLTSSSYDPDGRLALGSGLDGAYEYALPEHSAVTEALVAEMASAGLRTVTWTVDDPNRIQTLARWGVDGIITNLPEVALQVLEAPGLSGHRLSGTVRPRAGILSAMGSDQVPPEVVRHYETGVEAGRLDQGAGRLERARAQEILGRYLASASSVVLDIGGGPGAYSLWLAERGHEVHLIDILPLHVEQAVVASRSRTVGKITTASVGDARKLEWPDTSVDAVVMFGPLYHLTERDDRLRALREARRVLRPKGILFAAGISRFASLLDGFHELFIDDPEFVRIVKTDLVSGQHRNPSERVDYFTTSYFHTPEELLSEMREAGFRSVEMLAVEGFGWLLPDFEERWADQTKRDQLLGWIRTVEREPSLMGMSAHIMGVGRLE